MKWLMLAALLVLQSNNVYTLLQLRQKWHEAIHSKAETLGLIAYFERNDPAGNAVLTGYKAATFMLMAKHGTSPVSKYKYFNAGKELLDTALSLAPKELELHYLRYMLQLHAPAFLHYNAQLNADKNLLVTRARSISDKDLHKRVISFLLLEGNLTAAEKERLH